jgi:hypothetical protein
LADAWKEEYHEQCGRRRCPSSTSHCEDPVASNNPAWREAWSFQTLAIRPSLRIDRVLKVLPCNFEAGQILGMAIEVSVEKV